MENCIAPTADKIPYPAPRPLEWSAHRRRFRQFPTAHWLRIKSFRLDSHPENFFRTGLTDQTNFLSVGGVVFIEVTAREKRHFPGLEISGSNLMTRHDLTLLDWRNITIAPHIKITTEVN